MKTIPAFACLGAGLAMLIAALTAQEPTPGAGKSAKKKIVEAGAEVLPSEDPLHAIHAHVCGFQFYNGQMDRQVVAHHYCAQLNEDVMQCLLYDSDKADARLIGIEYLISARVFATLPPEEKKLWHSHVHEAKSGELIAPGIADVAEKQLMRDLAGTYGKTWLTWQVDRGDTVPLGIPQLMMNFTEDGQVKPEILGDRDAKYGIRSSDKRHEREDLPLPQILDGADDWQKEGAVQLDSTTVESKTMIPTSPKK